MSERLKEAMRIVLAAAPSQPLPDAAQPTYPACKGTNCGATDGRSHSPECVAEHDAACLGAQPAEAQAVRQLLAELRAMSEATRLAPGEAVKVPQLLAEEGRKFMRGEPSLVNRLPLGDIEAIGSALHTATPSAQPAEAQAGERFSDTVAMKIMNDLDGRRGVLDEVCDEVKSEILAAIATIIADTLSANYAAPPKREPHTPNEKLLALADRIDHERLWARAGLERRSWTEEQHDRCDAGVELRRYADLLGEKCWRVFPPKAGLSFRASTFEKVVEMAGKEAARIGIERAAAGEKEA